MPGLFKNVLCAVDFDENCAAAIETACNLLAGDGDGLLYVFHAVSFRFALTKEESEFPLYETKERLEKLCAHRQPSNLLD